MSAELLRLERHHGGGQETVQQVIAMFGRQRRGSTSRCPSPNHPPARAKPRQWGYGPIRTRLGVTLERA